VKKKRIFTFEIEEDKVTFIRDGEVIETQPIENFSYGQSRLMVQVFKDNKIIDIIPTGEEVRTLNFCNYAANKFRYNVNGIVITTQDVILQEGEYLPEDYNERKEFILEKLKSIGKIL
jgi:hypothetical protein